jgi:hypothetical protein
MIVRHLENQRFGRLVVIERVTGTTWRCRCDCGKEKIVSTKCLTSGFTRSCGCLRKESHYVDITGQRFGRLVAFEPTGKTRNNSAIWRFKCDCGKELEATVDSVKWGGRQSCGCLQYETKVKQALNLQQKIERVKGTIVNNIISNKLYVNNKSGYKGVSWHKGEQRWVAKIQFKGKMYHLGYYSNKEEAAASRAKAEERLHGPFLEWYKAHKKRNESI